MPQLASHLRVDSSIAYIVLFSELREEFKFGGWKIVSLLASMEKPETFRHFLYLALEFRRPKYRDI